MEGVCSIYYAHNITIHVSIHVVHVPGGVTARFTVTDAPGEIWSAQVTAIPDGDTRVGVKVMMLVSPFVLFVKTTTTPIAVLLKPTGLAGKNVEPEP